MAEQFQNAKLVPSYHVPFHGERGHRTRRLADATALLAERLDRLPAVFPHWRRLDLCAYFDLRRPQAQAMLRWEQLGATLDVTIYADLLSPAFRTAERYWAREFCPAFHVAGHVLNAASVSATSTFVSHFRRRVIPAMQRRLQTAVEEIAAAGELLFQRGDVTFLAAAAGHDERTRHLPWLPPDDAEAVTIFHRLPSLTLSRSFDLLDVLSEP